MERLAPPGAQDLLRELEPDAALDRDERARALAIAELNQRLGDVSFELGLAPATFTALIRICLASGSGLALFAFVTSAELAPLERALRLAVAASAGLVGAASVAALGRSANVLSQQIRENWDRASRDVGKALGTSLEAPDGARDTSR
ncbi:MAG TPA: hypothetical protein VHW01_06615 [Polyangiaceae bacterium]|nr:hypothetical protein [Polyangiaceae bacterium]